MKPLFRLGLTAVSLLALCAVALAQAHLPPGNPVTRAELLSEIDVKLERVHNFLLQQHLAGVLLTRVDNFTWVTAGIANNMIVITSETGAASVLIMQDGHKYVIANQSEMPRLMQEDFAGLGYEPKPYE